MHRWGKIALLAGLSLAAAGCPKGELDYSKGRKAETLQDYDAALEFYQKALKSDPTTPLIRFDTTKHASTPQNCASRKGSSCAKKGTWRARPHNLSAHKTLIPPAPSQAKS